MFLRYAACVAFSTAGFFFLSPIAKGQTVIDAYDAELGVGNNGFDAPDEQGDWCSHTCGGSFVGGGFVEAAGGDPSYFNIMEDGTGFFRLNAANPGGAPGIQSALHSADG